MFSFKLTYVMETKMQPLNSDSQTVCTRLVHWLCIPSFTTNEIILWMSKIFWTVCRRIF